MLEVHRPPEDEDGLPEYVRDRPSALEWERPTAWLLGAHVLSSLRQLVLSAIHTGFDLRDWMSAEPGGIVLHEKGKPRPDDDTGDGAYWFDFVADTGDAPALVYCLGRAIQRKALVVECGGKQVTLPRGRMLVVGGDTAYPVADKTALCERWQAPLVWASRQPDCERPAAPLPVFAIPGNHDYYDALDGFGRQFRKQVTADGVASVKGAPPPLRLPGYERRQSATYFRLHLPFDWQVWGVDLGTHPDSKKPIDTRQLEYFRGDGHSSPKKLICVTSVPVAVNHAPVDALVAPFKALGLPPTFDPHHRFADKDPPEVRKLPDASMRLDLSGDVHLYQRYFGSKRTSKEKLESDHDEQGPDKPNYAAVVSGLGGAFHHPVQVRAGDADRRVRPQSTWPPEAKSRADIGEVLTRPRKVFQAGSVGVLGGLLGALFFLLAHEWSGPGVLALPALLAYGSPGTAGVARDVGAAAAFVGGLGVWIGFAIAIRAWTSRIRKRAFDPRASWSWIHRALDDLLRKPLLVRVLRWFGANRRVVISVLRRLVPWSLFLASFAGVLWWADYLDLGRRGALGTNIAATLLLVWMLVFPLLTNMQWRTPSLARAYRAVPFVLLGAVHGVAQLFAPYLWAEATCAMIVPFALLVGYWCVRPLANELLRVTGRAFVLIWLLLVVGIVGTPLVLLVRRELDGIVLAALYAWLGVCVLGVVAGAYRLKRRLRERLADTRTDDERRAFPRVRRWKWIGFATLVWLVFPLQIVVIALLPDAADWSLSANAREGIGFVAAVLGGAIFACLWLGWYLLVCLQWGWHGNDAGSVARIDDYAEFLRIKLTADRAEVWTIGVDARETADGDYPATIRLVDHFTVTTKGG